ncbi:MAG TPA: tetratricopeptide repeat protein [Bacteroidia bacterium]
MKKTTGFLLLLIISSIAVAQNYNDSISLLLTKGPLDSIAFKRLVDYNDHFLNDQPNLAIANAEKFEKVAEQINCKSCLIAALRDRGSALRNVGNYNASLEILLKALSLTEEETKIRSAILNNISNVYVETGNYEKAILYLKKAVLINEKKQYLTYLGINYNNLGVAYKNLKDLPKALYYYNESTKIRIKLGRNQNLAQSYINLSEVYGDLKKNDTALLYANEAMQICDSLKSDLGLAFVYICFGNIYLQQNDLQNAKKSCLKSYELSKKINSSMTLIRSTLLLYEIHKASGEFQKAMLFQEEYYKAKDSIFNSETTKKQLTLEYQNELSIKNAAQEKKDSLARQESEKQSVIKNIFIGGFAVMLFLSLIILKGYRNKRKANKIIAAQKEETELQKRMLEEKQKELLDSIHYAKRIQQSLLTTEKYIDKNLRRLNKKT